MQEQKTLARPYAEAAFKQAGEEQSYDSWADALNMLAIATEDKALRQLLDNPAISKDDLTNLVLRVLDSKLSATQQNLVKLLGLNNRLGVLVEIKNIFDKLLADHNNRIEVKVHSAFPLDDGAKAKLETYLENELQSKVDLEMMLEPELIGGVLIKAGDLVIDSSVRGNFEKMTARVSI